MLEKCVCVRVCVNSVDSRQIVTPIRKAREETMRKIVEDMSSRKENSCAGEERLEEQQRRVRRGQWATYEEIKYRRSSAGD